MAWPSHICLSWRPEFRIIASIAIFKLRDLETWLGSETLLLRNFNYIENTSLVPHAIYLLTILLARVMGNEQLQLPTYNTAL
jgi:hypothetical protein